MCLYQLNMKKNLIIFVRGNEVIIMSNGTNEVCRCYDLICFDNDNDKSTKKRQTYVFSCYQLILPVIMKSSVIICVFLITFNNIFSLPLKYLTFLPSVQSAL